MVNLSWLQWPNSHCCSIDLRGPRRFKFMPKRDLVNQPLNTQYAVPAAMVPSQNKTETSAQFGVGRTGQIQTYRGNKQPESHQILLWSGAVSQRRRAQRLFFTLYNLFSYTVEHPNSSKLTVVCIIEFSLLRSCIISTHIQWHSRTRLTLCHVHRSPAVQHQRRHSAGFPLSAAVSRRRQSCSYSSPGSADRPNLSPIHRLLQ